jgi:hypothetical protein
MFNIKLAILNFLAQKTYSTFVYEKAPFNRGFAFIVNDAAYIFLNGFAKCFRALEFVSQTHCFLVMAEYN